MDNSIRIINICDNRENSKRLSDSSCKERIKISINQNRTFSDVETEFAFTNPKDIKVLLSYYTEIFLKALPFKTKVLIDKLFNEFNEDLLVEWANVVYNPRSTNEDLEELIKVAPFYECFTNLRDKNNDVDYTKFYATLRNEFSTVFINISNITGILQIFQFLLRCKSLPSPNQSTLFCDTVKKFIRDKCAGSDVNLEAETEAKTYDEHYRLAELIENFVDTPYKSVYDLIKNIFPSTTVIPATDGNKSYVKIKGYQVIWSNIFNKNPLIFDNCDVVEVQAENELIIDDNINLPGITLTLSSLNCVFMKPIIINLSGKNDNTIMPKAQNGVKPGEKGEDGKNGKAGQSSGNFVLVSKNIQKIENLKLILCGGKGMQGQDGGDGADGADGVGVKFEDQFGTAHKLRTGAKQTVNALTVGIMSRVFDKMIEKQKDDGTFKCFNDSPVYFSTHSFSFVRGADGRPGGKGGKNGIGGQGGKKGSYKIIDRETENENIAVTAEDGDKGNDGFPGKNADPGKDGWDIAVLNRTFGRRIEFGKEHNEKLFFKLEDNESENSVFIKDKNCFAKIIKQPCTKERLKETEQFTEFNTNSEMNGESIAVAAVGIDISALMEDRHTAVTNEINEEQQEIKSGLDEEINVERVMELWIDDKEEPYTPKERHKTPLFPEDCFEDLDLNNGKNAKHFWSSRLDFLIDELIDNDEHDKNILRKLKKKHALFKLRSLKREIESAPVKLKSDVSQGDLLFIHRNYYQYCHVLNSIKIYEIDAKSLEFHVPIIDKAFTDKNLKILSSYANKLSTIPNFNNEFPEKLFKIFDEEFEALSEAIKKEPAFRNLFYIVKLFENILVNNVFFQSLNSDENQTENISSLIILQKRRTFQANKFMKNFQIYVKDIEDELRHNDQLAERLEILFQYFNFNESTLFLQKELEFLCTVFPAIANVLLNSLLLVFEVEGCHIDLHTLKYLIDTVFDACKMYETFNCFIFPSILLITNQEQWIDQFFIFNTESAFLHPIKQKAEFLEILEQFQDENLKILCTKKLYESTEKLSDDALLKLLKAIKSSVTLFPQVKEIDLEKFEEMMKKISFSQNMDICDQEWNRLDKKNKNFVIFWCNKLIGHFGLEYVQFVKSEILKFAGCQKDVIGRLIHRLCEYHSYTIESAQALKNLFEAVLDCLNKKNINDLSSRYEYAKMLLADDEIIAREFEDIQILCQLLNKNGYTEMLKDILKKLSKDHDESVSTNIDYSFQTLEEKINKTLEFPMLGELRLNYLLKYEKVFSKCSDKIDGDLYYLQIVDKFINKIFHFNLRFTQKIAVLCALKNYDVNGILQQVSTGEGKTLIIAVISIISVLKGKTVNIVTSSPVLARRDVSNYSKLYKEFGLKVKHICYDSAQSRKRIYSKCHIIYGDLTSYQRDFLMDSFYSTNVSSSRKFDIMIVDEVDSLLLDNGLNTLYLSHNIADFEMLYPLIIQIWDEVMNQLKKNGKCRTEKFHQHLCKKLFPIVPWHEMPARYSKAEIECFKRILYEYAIIGILTDSKKCESSNIMIKKRHLFLKQCRKIEKHFDKIFDQVSASMKGLKDGQRTTKFLSDINPDLIASMNNTSINEGEMFMIMLKKNGILDESNKLLNLPADELEEKLNLVKENFSRLLNLDFLCKYDEIMENVVVDVPRHLLVYVSKHLIEFIENAEIAFNMEEEVEYQIDMRFIETGSQKVIEPKIVIVDRDTGVDLPSTQWHNGLHQFLQLKHGLRLTPLSTKAVFISNITYLKKYKCIYGLSGTLGSDTEKQQLQEFYDLPSIVLPSSMIKQFYEEQSIVTNSEEQHYQEIFTAIKEKMAEGRSVLIIGDSSKQIATIYKNVMKLASGTIPDDEMYSYKNAFVYKHDSDKFPYCDTNHKLDKKSIIFATNLAGRGTDILLTDELKKRGGLHVIISFLSRNIRIEEQAFGRAARCGERGTAQVIICDKSVMNLSNINIVELKCKRDAIEEKRIQKIQEHYESKLKVEEECFQHFCKKFNAIKSESKSKNESIISKNNLDNWALFLDRSEYQFNQKDQRIKAAKDFCEELRIDDNDPLLPQNMLLLAFKKMITGERNYEALQSLIEIGKRFPEYLPEVQYYSFYLIIQMYPSKEAFDEAKQNLYEARNAFIERQIAYLKLNDIVERHKIVADSSQLERDIFLQQQQESSYLIKRVVESIDVLMGQIIRPDAFMTNKICEEASMHLFEQLCNEKLFKKGTPIVEYIIKKAIDFDELTNYCRFNGLKYETVLSALENLKNSKNVKIKDLQDAFKVATLESFWMELEFRSYITDIENHIFINLKRLPKLSASKVICIKPKNTTKKDERIFDHVFVINNEWVEYDAREVENIFSAELINLLIKNQIICKAKSAIFANKFKETVNFDSFPLNTVTKADLMLYGIFDPDATEILNSFEKEGIFLKTENDQYSLALPVETNIIFISWYQNIVMKLIKQKLTFGLAIKALQNNINQQKPLMDALKCIPFMNENDETLVLDLISYGILESTNVCFNVFSLMEELVEELGVIDNNTTLFKKLLKNTAKFIKLNFDDQTATLISSSNVHIVVDIFKSHASIEQKLDTVNLTLNKIKQPNSLESNHLMITHGLMYLIACCDSKWSNKTLAKSTVVTAAGIVQLGTGAYLYCTPELLIPGQRSIGKIFFLEGMSDMTFGIKGFYHGHCDSYTNHKIKSIGFNASIFSANQSIDILKNVKVFKDIFTSNVKTMQNIIMPASSSPALSKIASLLNLSKNEEKEEIYFVVDEIIDDFKDLLHKTFRSNNTELRDLLIKGIQVVGADNLIDKDGLFKTYIQPPLFDICFFVASHLRQMIIENKKITTKSTLKCAANAILASPESSQFLGKLSKNMQSIIDCSKKNLCDKFNNSIGTNLINKSLIENQVDAFIKQWKGEIEEKGIAFLQNQLNNPQQSLDENDAEIYQKQLHFIASNAYFNLKKHVNLKISNVIDMEEDNAEKAEDDNFNRISKPDEFKKHYFEKLEELQTKVRNPQIYALTINESLKINLHGSAALSALVFNKLDLFLRFSNAYNDSNENHIKITNNFDKAAEHMSLYEQMCQKIPEFEKTFTSRQEFLNLLSNELAQIFEFMHEFKNSCPF